MKKYIILILLLELAVFSSLFALGNRETAPGQDTVNGQDARYNYAVSIDNMTCSLCNVAVEKQLSKLDWVQAVEGDHTKGLAFLQIDNPLDEAEMEKILNTELDKIDYNFVELRELTNG